MNALEVLESFEKALELTKEENTGCKLASETRHVVLPPKYLGRLRKGVSEVLDAELGKFSASLQGVLLAYGSIKLLQSSGVILDDSPFIHFDVTLQAVVFKPKIGSLLKCVVKEQASDHVGCLVHDWFNLSLLASRKELNDQRQLRLEPGYVLLVQVEQLHSLHGVLAIEARAPDDGSDLILEATAIKETDTESSVDSVLQPESDDPDCPAASTDTQKSQKKKKRSKVKQELEPSTKLQTGEGTTSPKKTKNRKGKNSRMDESNALTTEVSVAAGSETTELATTDEASYKKKKKKKKHIETELDPISEPAPDLTQETSGGETSHTKKKKKKRVANEADVDSNQPLVTQNGPASEDVVSYQSPPTSPNKSKKMEDRDLDSALQPPTSDIFPTPPEETYHKKAKKRKHRIKQESVAGDGDYHTEASGYPEEQLTIKTEPGAESTTEDSQKTHKKRKRKAEEFDSERDASVTNGSVKKKKRKNIDA